MAWISDDDRWAQLYRQAESEAAKLGHRLGGWVADPKAWEEGVKGYVATCLNWYCWAEARVALRAFGRPAVGGDATQLRCRPADGAPPERKI